jgi:choline dehydrogenase-like flavoprotein
MLMDLAAGAPELLEADAAIIGAGAAGLTMARALVAGGKSVILLESGGLDYEPATADLNAGVNVGEPYYDLAKARLRFFGGTTAIWGGRCAELDPIDFQVRPWVEHSGWPFTYDDIQPFYRSARQLLDLPAEFLGSDGAGGLLDTLACDDLAVRHWEFDRRFDRFSFHANQELINHPRLTAVLHANVQEIIPSSSGGAVDRLDVRAPGGRRIVVRAGTIVLAAGGLENPRLLLASNSVMKDGLGNQHDLVGRFFMEHPHGRGGHLVGAPIWPILKTFGRQRAGAVQFAPLLTASPELQAERRILNSGISIAARPPVGGRRPLMKQAYLHAKHRVSPTEAGRSLWKSHRSFGRMVKERVGPIGPWWRCLNGRSELALVVRAEQSPNPDSRVTLDTETDATGMPRIRLDWRLQEQDVESARALVDALARQAAAQGLGKVEPAGWLQDRPARWAFDDLVSDHPIGGYHHIGTTRMHEHPRRGVADGYGRVHGLDNLYVAGSSLFPTAGWANPTLTILALTLRTAEHILSKT